MPIEDDDLANFMEYLESEELYMGTFNADNMPRVAIPNTVQVLDQREDKQASVTRNVCVSEVDVLAFIEGKIRKIPSVQLRGILTISGDGWLKTSGSLESWKIFMLPS